MKKVIVISDKDKSQNIVLKDKEFENIFYSKKIHDIIKIDYSEHSLVITGGSTNTGTPLDSSISERGYKKTKKGLRYGNYIDEKVSQVNLKVIIQ